MTFYEGYSAEDFSRVLTTSQWIIGILAVLAACAGIFNQWVSGRISDIQNAEKIEAQQRLIITEEELESTKARTLDHDDILSYRSITKEQREAFIAITKDSPKGKVFVICIQGDTESHQYATAINEMLFSAGYQPTNQVSTFQPFGGPVFGIQIGIESKEEAPIFTAPLIQGFVDTGFIIQPTIVSGAASRGPQFIHITVGSKDR